MNGAGSVAPIEVCEFDASMAAEWNAFVESQPGATFFHRHEWKDVIEKSFGHRCHFLCARLGNQILGVLPLVHIKSRLFSNALISTAFGVCGGPVAANQAVRNTLEQAAIDLAQEIGVDHLEFRLDEPSGNEWACNDELYVTFRKDLDPDPEKNLSAIPRKQRAMVRKGIKFGLTSEIDSEVDRFYALYSESVRNLGTPVFSKKYVEILKSTFGDACEVLTIVHEGQPVCAVMNFYFRDQVLPYYGGGGASARQLAGNDFMYWETMRRATERGCKVFDFGRSKRGTGSFAFKKNWGFTPEPLSYEYKLFNGASIPNVNPTNPKYKLMISTWKKLPLFAANAIGPIVAKDLG